MDQNSLHDGVIRHKGKIYVGKDTDQLRDRLLHALHSSALGGYFGMKVTYHRLKKIFYWPGMKRDVDQLSLNAQHARKTKGKHVLILVSRTHLKSLIWCGHMSVWISLKGYRNQKERKLFLWWLTGFLNFAHFIPLAHPFTMMVVATMFTDNVLKLHGPPLAIVSDRDQIFTSKLWQDIFRSMGSELLYSSAYHPQSDAQTERVNQCIKNYLCCMAYEEPTKWTSHLAMAEYWYNTSFHSSLQKTPFEAMYGYPPPSICENILPDSISAEAEQFLNDRDKQMHQLKDNLAATQARMKKYADHKRIERSFNVGGMVYLKMQLYRLNAFGLKTHIKLQSKFYGPFRVIAKVGKVAYKLLLLEKTQIHPVFHVSQLKKHVGPQAIPCADLPLVGEDGRIKTEPV